MRLLVGDDWAEDHHDVEVMNEAGTVLAKRRLPEGVAGMTQLHELTGHVPAAFHVAAKIAWLRLPRAEWASDARSSGCVPMAPSSRLKRRSRSSWSRTEFSFAHPIKRVSPTFSYWTIFSAYVWAASGYRRPAGALD